MGKSDMSMAFRHVPMRVEDYPLLVLKAYHPVTGKLYYFLDKCLPFGSSVSCAIFQEVSNGIAHIFRIKVQCCTVNYLDDFFFVALLQGFCDAQINAFIAICNKIKFPVSLEKTVWASCVMTFLGFLIDSENQIVCVPMDKVIRARELIEQFLNRKKVTVREVQKLCGFLNFLCRCVVPGRAFTRRLYSLMAGNPALKAHHHVRVKSENKLDLTMWQQFLSNQRVFCRPFRDFIDSEVEQVELYSDASGSFLKGYGAWCKDEYIQCNWDVQFMRKFKPSIEYLELYAATVAVVAWIHKFANRKISLFCDNESVCNMLNNSSSTYAHCMVLIRLVTLKSLIHNVRVYGKHLKTDENGIADALSRCQWNRLKKLAPVLSQQEPSQIPTIVHPMFKVWSC